MGNRREKVKKLFADKEIKDHGHYTKKRAGVILSIISVFFCIFTVIGIIIINKLKVEFNSEENILRSLISEHPIISAIVMVLICVVQVIVAFIPGEVVEIAAGYAFGPWWGSVLCLFGITVGSIISMLLAKRFGRKLVEAFYPKEKLDSLPILGDPKKRNTITAILFLIPGTPKDLMTYILGLTEMSIPLYIVLTTLSRFPSVIMSTLSGDALGENKIVHAIWFLIITGVLSGLGYLLYIYIKKKTSSAKHKNNEK